MQKEIFSKKTADFFRHKIRTIVNCYPARLSGSAELRALSGDIEEEFVSLGYSTQKYRFNNYGTAYLSYVLHAFLGILWVISAVFFSPLPWLHVSVGIAVITSLIGEYSATFYIFRRLLPKRPSYSVFAKSKGTKKRATIVFSSHLDTGFIGRIYRSKSAARVALSRVLWPLRYPHLLVLCSLIFFLVAFILSTSGILGFSFKPILYLSALFVCSYLVLYIYFYGEVSLWGRPSPGANDNASGTAVLLRLASLFKTEDSDDIGIAFLATDGEEAGGIGMRSFLKQANLSRETTFFILLDNLGYGTMRYLAKEGICFPRSCPEGALEVLGAAQRDFPEFAKLRTHRIRNSYSDMLPVWRKNYEGLLITTFADGKNFFHTPEDTLENVDVQLVQKCTYLLYILFMYAKRHLLARSSQVTS